MSSLLSSLRVAVIGGGISGVATAAWLARLGCKFVTVYEKHSSLSALRLANSPAVVLQANGARVLDALGVLAAVSDSSAPIHRITQRNTRGDLLSSFLPSQFLHASTSDGSVLSSLTSPYSALHSAITACLPSSVQWAKEVETVKRDEFGYHIHFASPSASEVCVDLVVAADGADGSIGSKLVRGQPSVPQLIGGVLVKGVSEGATMWEEQRDNELLEIWGTGQRIGAVRLKNRQAYWYATVDNIHADAAITPRTLADSLNGLPDWVAKMVAATSTSLYLSGPLRHMPPTAPLYKDGIVLVGSSSVLLPPDLHQQLASSLESALALTLSLHSSDTVAAALQRYSSLRSPHLTNLHTAALSECQQAVHTGKLMSSLRDMASSLMPSQVRDATMERFIGYKIIKAFPEWNSQGAVVGGMEKSFGNKRLEDDDERDEELGRR